MAKISILVPVYNVERYLELCLESILAQTFTDFEVICMDDGSTDRSGDILDAYAKRDSRIRVVHKENAGYGKTMNGAMRLATGQYIGIVESDDTIEHDMYQILYDTVIANDLDLVKTDFYAVWDRQEGGMRKLYCSLTEERNMYNRVIHPRQEIQSYLMEKFTWDALYKRDLIVRNDIRYNETPGASYQDNGFWFQTFYWAERIMFLDQAFYNYRQDNMQSSIHSRQKVYAMKNEYDFIRHFMAAHGDRNRELHQICFHLRMLEYISTLRRIDLPLKAEFAMTIEKDRDFYEACDEAFYDYMTEEQVSIIRNPMAYTEDVLIQCKEITRDVVAGYKKIIVYGAGAYGERVIFRVKSAKKDSQTIKVAVTELDGKKMTCQGEDVCEISDCTEEKEASLVILAVKEESEAFYTMLDWLKKLKFPNIMTVSAKNIDCAS